MTKRTKAKPEHYVNNKEFTAAIAEHNQAVKDANLMLSSKLLRLAARVY